VYKVTVLYDHPDDPAEFDRYYYEHHMPIARKMEGLTRWTIGKCESRAGERPPYYLVVTLCARSRAEMDAILDSPAGRAAAADVANFASGGTVFLYDDEDVIVDVSAG
jgi:uncharacterized protein (TIGR02118 family)